VWRNERNYVQGYCRKGKKYCCGRFNLKSLWQLKKKRILNYDAWNSKKAFKTAWLEVTNKQTNKGQYKHCTLKVQIARRSLLTNFGVQISAMYAYMSVICITSRVCIFAAIIITKKTGGCVYVSLANCRNVSYV
jgi:hypothetical protein